MDENTRAIPLKKKRKFNLISAPGSPDKIFLILLLAVLAVGLVSLASASYAYAYYHDGNSYHYTTRQLTFTLIGLAAMIATWFFNYHCFHKLAFPLWALSIGLLILVLILPPTQGVHRWIYIGSISVQVSEIAKFTLILLLSHLISLNSDKMGQWWGGFILPIVIIAVPAALVLIETHLSGAILIVAIGLVLWYIGGVPLPRLLVVIALGCAAVFVVLFVLKYEHDRIEVWQDPMGVFTSGVDGRNQAWQTVQSLFAIGSGGLFGQGIGNSRQKYLFLPEPQNDFIFSVVLEEVGFIGGVLILLLFAALVARGLWIGFHAPDKFGGLLAIGLSAQVGLQVLLNVAVVTNLIPNTGISLPFFSYGGSSLVMLLAQMGIILNISTHINKDKT